MKYIYIIFYVDLLVSYKVDIVVKVQDIEFSYRFSIDIVGLVLVIDIRINYNLDLLYFSNVFYFIMVSFIVIIDLYTNGNGKLVFWGEYVGQLYSKFLLKVEFLVFIFFYDYKGFMNYNFVFERSISIVFDYKVSVLFISVEQIGIWKFKIKLNKNEYSQDFNVYNIKDKVGVEFSGRVLVDFIMLDLFIIVLFLFSEFINLIDVLEMRDDVD